MEDTFEPKTKAIYGYADGSGKKVYADPLILRGKLACLALEMYQKDLGELIDTANPAIKGGPSFDKMDAPQRVAAWNAMAALDEVSRRAFGLIPFNKDTGEGADMDHALSVMDHFHVWCEKKNQKPLSPSTSTPSAMSTSAT